MHIFPHFDCLYLDHSLTSCMEVGVSGRKCVNENRLLRVLKYPLGFSKYGLNSSSCSLDRELSARASTGLGPEMRRRPLVGVWAYGCTGCNCYTKQHAWVGGTPCVRRRRGGGGGGLRDRLRLQGQLEGLSRKVLLNRVVKVGTKRQQSKTTDSQKASTF